jgi:hypothetical protein
MQYMCRLKLNKFFKRHNFWGTSLGHLGLGFTRGRLLANQSNISAAQIFNLVGLKFCVTSALILIIFFIDIINSLNPSLRQWYLSLEAGN